MDEDEVADASRRVVCNEAPWEARRDSEVPQATRRRESQHD
jgi:hypothetical protein